ncbi:MAG: hypothetical protein KC486_02920 [Myxococcales bacterium]|nr:hypothetical protein [Myxococcales bacterium]
MTTTTTVPFIGERARSRIPVVRCERLLWRRLDPGRRRALGDALYAIFADYYAGFDREAFTELFLAREGVVVALLYGADGRLAGFCSVRRAIYSAAGQRFGVFSAGVYVDTDYRGGRVAARFGLGEALRFKLSHPWLQVAYLGLAHTPAPYRLFTQTMERVYPSRAARSGEPPEVIAAVMGQALADRGWPQVGEDPCVLATPMLARRSRWFERKPELRDDPDVRFFTERVPGWAEDGHALSVWIPLDLKDIAGAALRMLRQSVALGDNRKRLAAPALPKLKLGRGE